MTPFMVQKSGSFGCKGKTSDLDCNAVTEHNIELLSFGMII